MTEREHGTYATYHWHLKAGVPPCDACKAANTAYHIARRQKSPKARQAHRDEAAANTRALWRLAKRHPGEFRALCAEERQR